MGKYLFLAAGIWCLYHAWRGIVPDTWNPGNKLEVGAPMRGSTRVIFLFGGLMLTALGVSLWKH